MIPQICKSALLLLLLVIVSNTDAFQSSSSSFLGSSVAPAAPASSRGIMTMEYIPSGMSKEQWKQLKEKEKNNSKNLGKVGITKFQSRTLTDWQKAGGKNLFPVDPKSVKSKKDLPYMMRPGGSANDEDLKSPNPFGSLFGNKKKKPEEPAKKDAGPNWWTLN